MTDKEIVVPKFLRELHGEKTSLSNLIIVYLTGISAAGIVFYFLHGSGLALWKVLLVSILYLDIAGGVVANFSASTKLYYQDKSNLRVYFLILHVIHPALFIVVITDSCGYFAFTGAFTILASLLVNNIKGHELQQNMASFIVVTGILLSFFLPVPYNILYTFAPLFMVKLILGFSVKRPDLNA